MTTASQAQAAIRARLEAGATVPLYWQNVGAELPDEPTAFAYVEFIAGPGRIASFGGGRGSNRYRNQAIVTIFCFVPSGQGIAPATDLAELLAARLRSYRTDAISCFDATVHPGGDGADIKPPGLSSEVGNYYYAVAEVNLFYDLIG